MKKSKNLVLIVLLLVLVFTMSGCAKSTYMETPLGDGFGFGISLYIQWLVSCGLLVNQLVVAITH